MSVIVWREAPDLSEKASLRDPGFLPLQGPDHAGKLKVFERKTNIMKAGNRLYGGYYSS